ncbi:helix-turn-helix domain-containing protein [Devosia ginsengisoli]|uniref:Helix-turn-helix transcriptional regulator n=1 Tax=Devosia ginsengisoli TaxID=400770 RepID=A0A5B8LPY3_9HYPH|nr:helix-turn-helix transcriptional regulator [Devosia ginsengisoli]QDZ10131.1 helix-turn-helix transcriptional regulator [Devosia ginsengisoli]
MRAPIGFRISNRRKSLKISQAFLARSLGISPSYLNLIENNKRDIGGALLNRVAAQLDIDIDELAGRMEQKLLQDLEEAFADPMVDRCRFAPTSDANWWRNTRPARRHWRDCTGPIRALSPMLTPMPTGCARTRC